MGPQVRASKEVVGSSSPSLRAALLAPLTKPERAASATLAVVAAAACALGFYPRLFDRPGTRLLIATTTALLAYALGRIALRVRTWGGAATATVVFGALLGALDAVPSILFLVLRDRHGGAAVLAAGLVLGGIVGAVIGVLYGLCFAPFVAVVRRRLADTWDAHDRVLAACGAGLTAYGALLALLAAILGPPLGSFGAALVLAMGVVGVVVALVAGRRRRARGRFVADVAEGRVPGLRVRLATPDDAADAPRVDGDDAVLEAYGDDVYRDAPVTVARLARRDPSAPVA